MRHESAKVILLYVRPWNSEQMLHLARGVWGEDVKLHLASEHHAVDKTGLVATFNAKYKQTERDSGLRHLTEAEAEDIILRCRLLRSLDSGRARRLLVAIEHAVDKVLTETRPSIMLSLTIDSYVMDVFARLCEKQGIQFIGLVPSFVKDHFRISTRGEYVDSRLVLEAQIDEALSKLIVKDYRPDFLVQSEDEMDRQKWKLWLRNLTKPAWFALQRMKRGEGRNYHYWTSQILARRFWSIWPPQLNGISGPALTSLFEDDGLPLIYLPLQMSPEATIDYWSHDTRWIDYEDFIIKLLRRYRSSWRFAVKEHPNLVGFRSRGFYKRLEAEPNCVMVSPKVASNDLVSMCRGVLVCTGTAGFEAMLRGKPVLSDSGPYYAMQGALIPINTLDGELPNPVQNCVRQRELVAHVLRGTLPGRFLNNGKWSVKNIEHRAWSETMAKSIRDYLAQKQAVTAQ